MAIDRLGCAGGYDVQIRTRGGTHLWTTVAGLTELTWGRKRDDYSEATVTVTKSLAGADCCNRLAQTRVWGHEIRILRDGKPDPVWEGPALRVREKRATFTIEARDMLFWLDRRPITPADNYDSYFEKTPVDTGELIRTLITDGFPADDIVRNPGLIEWADLRDSGTQSTTAKLWRNTVTIGQVVRDLLGAGVDLYAIGRRIFAIPERDTSTPYRLGEDDFLVELEVVENGLDFCTQAILVGGQPLDGQGQPIQDRAPVLGIATAANPEPARPLDFWGLVTRMSSSTNTTDTTVAAGIARAILASGYPPPVDIVVPSQARLSPEAPVSIGQLVPGRSFMVLLENYCRPVRQRFRLNELEVTFSGSAEGPAEQVSVALASDGPIEGVPQ